MVESVFQTFARQDLSEAKAKRARASWCERTNERQQAYYQINGLLQARDLHIVPVQIQHAAGLVGAEAYHFQPGQAQQATLTIMATSDGMAIFEITPSLPDGHISPIALEELDRAAFSGALRTFVSLVAP